MLKTKQEIVLEELLKKASEKFVQKQYLAQAEFYDTWLEIGFSVEEISIAIEDAFDDLNKQLDELVNEVGIVPGKMN